MAFHDIRFPATLSFGSLGGPSRRTEVVTLANGYEERNSPWAHSRRRYDAGMGMRSLDDVETLIAFFEARRGQLYGFRWKDWSDYKSCAPSREVGFEDQLLGIADGEQTDFRLCKTYVSGVQSYARPICKPVEGSIRVGIGGDELTEPVHFTCDTLGGVVRFATPPEKGRKVTAGFEFDVPVRFDTDEIQISVASFQAGDVPSVPVVEIRL
ncbi:TIGR02217 family protein [Rhodobacterales bacterium HKCCE2091]|nr:TIGR02217 family protein [Rhodobacterales bacterium HKCCE2091]